MHQEEVVEAAGRQGVAGARHPQVGEEVEHH